LDEFNLDGIVSNAEINGAKILEVKYEEQPGYNTEPTQRTIAFLTYSSKHLYVGIKAYRDKVIAPVTTRDNAIIVMGDLNAKPSDAPIKLLAENLEDSFNLFPIKKPFGTFNGFDLDSKLLNRIDYIFTKNIEVNDYKHIQKKLPNKLWPSDHLPIFISIN
ncbi:endonuclease/exonuclease/phosphatase family protein, partial [Flavobacteriaceae bacterium]|nr:endonuclease/exonuclease/phosphatase family protein [Flavobacteriaceae bacterium]